ncbi:agmatinase [Puniceicoccaceae bacterium K14]|nr:agmatinase [Puniceicoccaceae bacterium K14]
MNESPYNNPPAFHSDDLTPQSPEDAAFHVIPVPWETSVSYEGGTQNGPAAILHASTQLEVYCDGNMPGEAGIYTAPEINCVGTAPEVLDRIQEATANTLKLGKFPILLGGEHAMTLGPIKAIAATGIEFGVIQFDAHADLREAYQGNPHSHASVMKRVHDLGIPIFSIGVRALCKEEADLRERDEIPHLDGKEFWKNGYPEQILPIDFPKNIFITFDVDGLDPSIMPTTGTPVPGGLTWFQAIDGLERLFSDKNVIGADIVELAPQPGRHDTDFLAANLVYKIMDLSTRSK